MILPALRWLVGAVQAVGEAIGAARGLVRAARRGTLPDPSGDHDGDTEPFPLTHKDAERIAEFGRRAGHETGTHPVVKSSRYD